MQSLDLSRGREVTDVSALGNVVHPLDLSGFVFDVTNVSAWPGKGACILLILLAQLLLSNW